MEGLDAKFWLDLVQWLSMAVLTVWIWLGNRHRLTEANLRKLEQEFDGRLDDHEKRITRAEKDIEAMPTQRDFRLLRHDISSIEGDLKALRSSVEGMRDVIKPISAQLARISDYLMNARS